MSYPGKSKLWIVLVLLSLPWIGTTEANILVHTRVSLGQKGADGTIRFMDRTSTLPGGWTYFYRYGELFGRAESIPWKHNIPATELYQESIFPWWHLNPPNFRSCATDLLCTALAGPSIGEAVVNIIGLGISAYGIVTQARDLSAPDGGYGFLGDVYGLGSTGGGIYANLEELYDMWNSDQFKMTSHEFTVSYPNPFYDYVLIEMYGYSEEMNCSDPFNPDCVVDSLINLATTRLDHPVVFPLVPEWPEGLDSSARWSQGSVDGIATISELPSEPVTMYVDRHPISPKVTWLVDLAALRARNSNPKAFFTHYPFVLTVGELDEDTTHTDLAIQHNLLLNIKQQKQPPIRGRLLLNYFREEITDEDGVRSSSFHPVAEKLLWEGEETAFDLRRPYLDGIPFQEVVLERDNDGKYHISGHEYDIARLTFTIESDRVLGASQDQSRIDVLHIQEDLPARLLPGLSANPTPSPQPYKPKDRSPWTGASYTREGIVSGRYDLTVQGLQTGISDIVQFRAKYGDFFSAVASVQIRTRECGDISGIETRTRVPTLIGWSKDRALEFLEDADLRANPINVYILPDPQWDRVRDQDPANGRLVEPGTVVTFEYTYPGTLPSGEVIIPSIIGLDADQAEVRLRNVGLRGQRESTGFFVLGEKYKVIRQHPEPSATGQRGSITSYWLELDASNMNQVSVPNIVGLTVEKAHEALRRNHLSARGQMMNPATFVTGQDPPAGNLVQEWSHVVWRVE